MANDRTLPKENGLLNSTTYGVSQYIDDWVSPKEDPLLHRSHFLPDLKKKLDLHTTDQVKK